MLGFFKIEITYFFSSTGHNYRDLKSGVLHGRFLSLHPCRFLGRVGVCALGV